MTDGIICIDKQPDWTSFDVVAKCRRLVGIRRAGHGGTLDPMATGVLPLFFGRATRAADIAPRQDKRYTAGFRLGLATATQDIWGEVLRRSAFCASRAEVEAALSRFSGEIEQLPPMYSAVQVGGRRLYDLARQGVEVERQPRRVTVHGLRLLSYDPAEGVGALDISCSKGTYIRAIIGDMGEALGCGAAMTSLRRTRALGFSLADCVTVAELERIARDGALDSIAIPVERVFAEYPPLALDARQTELFRSGARLDIRRIPALPDTGLPLRLFEPDGAFAGLARIERETDELIMIKQF